MSCRSKKRAPKRANGFGCGRCGTLGAIAWHLAEIRTVSTIGLAVAAAIKNTPSAMSLVWTLKNLRRIALISVRHAFQRGQPRYERKAIAAIKLVHRAP